MVSQKTLILSLGLVVVVATLALPLSAHPSLQSDAEHQQEETPHSPGMRRLTWWRWGRRNNNKKEKTTTEPTTTTEVPVTDYITTTKKPSRWRSWFSRAKEKISNAAKKVKGKYERGMSVVDNVAKNGFYKAGKAIVLGVKKVGNATITVGRKIKKGTKRIGSAVKRGYQKIRLKFSGPDEKFKILANRIKDKVESGDGRAVDLLKKIGIHITLSDQKITGSHVVSKNISVTEILKNEGMLSNKTSSSYHTALEDPEITASTDRTGINESIGSEISPAEDDDEFHSAEEYLTSEPNITDTKVEYERATTEVISSYESPISDTDRYETSSTIHQGTTTELSEPTFSESFTFLTESSSHEDMEYNIESTSSFLSTEENGTSTNIPVTNPSTDSVFKEDSSSSTITTGTSDSPLYLATISSFNESTKHSSVDQPLEETLLPITETTAASLNMNETGDTTTSSTIIPTTPVDIHPAISVNTIHPLNLDISVTENSTSGVLDEYKMTTLQHSSAAYINRDISPTTEAISLSTLHDTSPLSVTSPDFIIPLSGETSSFTSTITATPPTSTPTVTYASTTLTPTTDPSTTSSSTLPPTTSTITATSPITSEIVTTVLLPIISISTASEHLPTTLPQTTSTSTMVTSIPTTSNLPSTTSTFTTTTLPTTISTSTTTPLPSTTSISTTTLPPTTSIPIYITIPSTTSTSTTTTLPTTTSTPTTTTPLPTTSTSTTTTPLPTTSTSTTTTPLPTTSTSTTTTPPPTTSTSTTTTPLPTTTPPPTTSTSTTTTPLPTTSTSTTTTPLPTTSTSTTTTPLPTTSTSTTTTPLPTTSTSTTTTPLPTTSTSTTTTPLPTTSTSTTTAPPPTTLVVTIPPTTTQPPPPTTTIPSTYPPTPTIRTHPPTFTVTKMVDLAPTSPSTSIHGDKETIVEEAYVPPPFPDVFSDIEVHDRLREFYDNGDFSHAEMAELFNFDPDNYEYYKYDYNYEDYAR
ncbi:mucin-2-like [Palaemon carinicauda]|uniref:mucin-2-like n=1 Tax=Palaemon carinicauda TaxID=392227 RepID=UPI0035B65F44